LNIKDSLVYIRLGTSFRIFRIFISLIRLKFS
jgi:hypothetical protein